MIWTGFAKFGGLSEYLKDRNVHLVVDMTHPFASVISPKAADTCSRLSIPYLRFERPAWKPLVGDRWISVEDLKSACRACEPYTRLFLSIGRQEISCFLCLTGKLIFIRSIEPIDVEGSANEIRNIIGRGPFSLEDELVFLKDQGINVLITKNSGGDATYAKIEAARQLQIPVVMIDRPYSPPQNAFTDIEDLKRSLMLYV